MRHPEFPVISFVSILLLICSLPSHIRAGSIPMMALIAWLAVMSLIRGVNSLIWANNVVVRLEVWCDITTKITIGFTYAVPAAALCILRHLESVSSARHVHTTRADKRLRQKFEALMCFGIPLLFMALHYIVQGHRFDLFEDIGCSPTVYVSVAGLCLVFIPPIAISLTTFVYAALALRNFFRHRIEFATHLQNSHSSISPGRYFRLMSMAVIEMVWDTGVNAYIIYFNTFTGLRPWISWENVHSNFSRIQLLPEFLIPREFKAQLIFQWWILPVSCICFFIFFGFGEEAMSDYRAVIVWFRRTILKQNIKKLPPYGSMTTLPAHRPRPSHVNITLPTMSDDASEHKANSWDDMSVVIPEITEHIVLPSSTASRMQEVPALTDTRLEREMSFTAEADFVVPTMETTPPVQHRVSALIVSRPHSYRSSTSSDLGIDVSPAYLPEDGAVSRYHEDASRLRETLDGGLPSRPEPVHPHPLGGIRMTVEKSVV